MNTPRQLAWDMYYTCAMTWFLHPGNRWQNSAIKDQPLDKLAHFAAELADCMLLERNKRTDLTQGI